MTSLTKIEQMQLLAFIKTFINKNIGENIKEEIAPIYFKLEKEFKEEWKKKGNNARRIIQEQFDHYK